MALFRSRTLSINTSDHLVDVKKCFDDDTRVTQISLHRTKCTAILKHVTMPHFIDKLKEDINGRKFSVLLDESTNISVNKHLGRAICFYSESAKKIVSTFLQLAPLTECNASAIVVALKTTLEEHGLDMHNLIGTGMDSASVTVGINNTVYQNLEFLVSETYNWFARSPSRQ